LRERKAYPEASKQLDDGDERENAHQAAHQPGETHLELLFMPSIEFQTLSRRLISHSRDCRCRYVGSVLDLSGGRS